MVWLSEASVMKTARPCRTWARCCTAGSLKLLGGLDHHRLSVYEAIVRDALSQWGSVIRSNDIHQTLGWRSNVDLITGPTCGKGESQDRRRGRLHGRGRFGGDVCRKNEKGQWPPDPMPRTTSGPYSADPNDEVCGGEAFRFGQPWLWSETLIATKLQ